MRRFLMTQTTTASLASRASASTTPTALNPSRRLIPSTSSLRTLSLAWFLLSSNSPQNSIRSVGSFAPITKTTFGVSAAQHQHQQPKKQQQDRKMTDFHTHLHHHFHESSETLYAPYRKHPELFGDTFKEEWLHPDLLEIVKVMKDYDKNHSLTTNVGEGTMGEECPDPKGLTSLMREEAWQVYSFNCFSPTFLKMFNEELMNFYEMSAKYHIPVRRPNSMNNYGVIVNEIGMRPMITSLQQNYLWPIAKVLFPVQASPKFDDHHSFIVRYQAEEDLGLDMHIDDSDVTFNVCLGEPDFTGATLVFCGMFGKSDHRKVSHTYHHEMGRAVIHLGSRRHGAEDIDAGTRTNLIVWNHNWSYRKSPEYRRQRHSQDLYEPEEGPPDAMCLSWTHDRDFTKYKPLPKQAEGSHTRGWCPPPGKEYDGFYDKVKQPVSQDQL